MWIATKARDVYLLLMAIFAIAALLFVQTLAELVIYWLQTPEYGHGILIAGIAGYLVWQRRKAIASIPATPSPFGLLLLLFALALFLVSSLGDVRAGKFYAVTFIFASIPLALGGAKLFRPFRFPIILILFSVPLHPVLNQHLTRELQLISSDIGVWFIRAMGMPVLQDGNIINMGSFIMLVEEACSGLRYLLPLTGISLLAAYYFKANLLVRSFIFLSSVPITVMMNSLRIAVTGWLIKYYGASAAEGFLHDFEGWFVFLAACGLLAGVLAIVALALRGTLSFAANIDAGKDGVIGPVSWVSSLKPAALVVVVLVLSTLLIHLITASRADVQPKRDSFSSFPLVLDGRDLYPDVLSERILGILKTDDYFIGDFYDNVRPPINLYMAYYGSQREGSLIHSPKDCLPAGGWEIESTEIIQLQSLGLAGDANRVVISKGDQKLLVYYWVAQQGISYAKESDLYYSLLKRAILYGRTEGSLVRLFIPVGDTESDMIKAEAELQAFVRQVAPVLPKYIPE